MGIGLMFTGLIYCLFKAIEAVDVSTAILSYFTYPVLTGLTASLLRIEPLRWKGALCAHRRIYRPCHHDRRASGRLGARRRGLWHRRRMLARRACS